MTTPEACKKTELVHMLCSLKNPGLKIQDTTVIMASFFDYLLLLGLVIQIFDFFLLSDLIFKMKSQVYNLYVTTK